MFDLYVYSIVYPLKCILLYYRIKELVEKLKLVESKYKKEEEVNNRK